MDKREIRSAMAIARSDRDLSKVDDANLYGCALPEFTPVHTTLDAVAKLARYQCATLDGGWDADEFDSICRIAKRKFMVI